MATINSKWLYQNQFKLILILISLHSFAVGTGLIFAPGKLFTVFGLSAPTERFFPVQGGVFHYVMAIIYFIAAKGLDRNRNIILITIMAKCLGALFLIMFHFLVEQAWIILFSGILDLMMALIAAWYYYNSFVDFNTEDWFLGELLSAK